MKLSDGSKIKQTVSSRVYKVIAEEYRANKIPVDLVTECALIYFLKLDDAGRIRFIAENLPENVHDAEVLLNNTDWSTMLIGQLKALRIPDDAINEMMKTMSNAGIIQAIAGIKGIRSFDNNQTKKPSKFMGMIIDEYAKDEVAASNE